MLFHLTQALAQLLRPALAPRSRLLMPQLSRLRHVLLVGGSTGERTALSELLAEALPQGCISEVQGLSDAVLQLARGGVDLVVLDLQRLGSLSVAAPVLLRGLAPQARLLAVAAQQPVPPGLEAVADEQALRAWLQRRGGR